LLQLEPRPASLLSGLEPASALMTDGKTVPSGHGPSSMPSCTQGFWAGVKALSTGYQHG
jgi:hypothetical protein